MGIFHRKPNIEKLKGKRDVEGLFKALYDQKVRYDAIQALSEIAKMASVDLSIREEACWAIAKGLKVSEDPFLCYIAAGFLKSLYDELPEELSNLKKDLKKVVGGKSQLGKIIREFEKVVMGR